MSSSSSGRSNLGPLTTIFTPPSTCSVLGINSIPPTIAWQAQQCLTSTTVPGRTIDFTDKSGDPTSVAVSAAVSSIIYSQGVADDQTCRPSGTHSGPLPQGSWGLFSPGTVCPSGYYHACTGELDSNGSPVPITGTGTSFPFQYPLTAGETAVGCCPSSYVCAYNPQTCVSTMSTGTLLATACYDYTSTTTYILPVPISTGSRTVSEVMAFAPLVQIVWQSTDVHSVVTVTSSSDDNEKGLDTGDQAAIGVGVVALVLLTAAVVLGVLLLRRRRKTKGCDSYQPNNSVAPASSPKEVQGRSVRAETEGTPLNELQDPQTDFSRRNG